MLRKTVSYIIAIVFLINLHGCVKKVVVIEEKPVIPEDTKKFDEKKEYEEEHITQVISTDTVWSGRIVVDGIIKVIKGAKLTIEPGTVVEFAYDDYDQDGLGDNGLLIEGGISALGAYDEPILFTSDEGHKRSGAWGMILINFSNEVIFDYCKFEYSTYTLHIHFSTGSITNSLFTENEDGTRIGRSRFFIYNNVFKDNNVKGVNFTDSKNEIRYNTITGNKHGIFLFEGDKKSDITHNNIYDNRIYDFKLGDFFVGDIDLYDNYWGDITIEEAESRIFDKKYDDTLGVVSIMPARDKFEDAGIIREVKITKVFEFETEGYIDSSAAVDEESGTIYFGSYDGYLYAIDAYSGTLKFRFDAEDIIDSSPAVYEDSVYFASWNNNVYCIDKNSGELNWVYTMQRSEQDDHRQSSPVIHDGKLYIGGYDGTVYALDCDTGDEVWKFMTNGAIRSKGVIAGDTIIFGSADGVLYGISLKSGRGKWFLNLKSPILATPLNLGDVIVAATKDSRVYAIDADTKTVNGKLKNTSVNFYSAPVSYKGDVVFTTTDNKLYRLKKYGLSVKSISDIKGPAYATPSVYKDFLLTPTNLGNLNIIERGGSLRVIDYFLADDAIQGTPLVFDDKIYFGARDNKFYAIKIDIITDEGF
jgi:parallel beta-helix repeat protein